MKPQDFPTKLAELMEKRKPFAVATIINVDGSTLGKPGFKIIITSDENVPYGTLGGACPESALLPHAKEVMKSGKPKMVKVFLEEAKDAVLSMNRTIPENEIHVETFCGGIMDIFLEPYNPAQRLIIVGQGGKDDVQDSIIKQAKILGYEVVLLDHAPVLGSEPDEVLKDVKDDLSNFELFETDSVVVLTKGARDIPILEALSKKNLRYVGLMASKKRVKADKEQLSSKGVSKEFLDQMFAPIGIDIGAVTPDEIAISIMGQVVKVNRELESTL